MNILKSIFTTKEKKIKTSADFWTWFQKNQKVFFSAVENNKDVETIFFDKLSSKLGELKEGYFFLTGMHDDNTAELILTADGNTKNIVFVEELVSAAPTIDGWKFTCLKQPIDLKNFYIEMGGYKFNSETLSFYPNELPLYQDEIDITIVHNDLTEENKKQIESGAYIFLDNYLGELDFLNNIDTIKTVGKSEAKKELIPIVKLKDFLNWRQKEFVEKYEGIRYNTENDNYSMLEAELENGNNLIAIINTELLNWDSKASHPWICVLTLKFDGSNNNGMPDKKDYKLLDIIEDELMQNLKDNDGFLNIGRQTANSERDIYFACKDFRKPSIAFFNIQQKFSENFEIEYEIYKDKYWQSFERFNNQ